MFPRQFMRQQDAMVGYVRASKFSQAENEDV